MFGFAVIELSSTMVMTNTSARPSRPIRCDVWIVERMRYRPTDRQTDRPTDTASYRDALLHLKRKKESDKKTSTNQFDIQGLQLTSKQRGWIRRHLRFVRYCKATIKRQSKNLTIPYLFSNGSWLSDEKELRPSLSVRLYVRLFFFQYYPCPSVLIKCYY